MKKKLLIGSLLCLALVDVKAQVYSYDSTVPMPVMELYDKNLMNTYLNTLEATAARREQNYRYYGDKAMEAFDNRDWSHVVSYVNSALATQFYCGTLYYIRGYAYEQLGNLRAAKSDYKAGKKYNCVEAAEALDALKARMKRKK